MKLLRLFLLTFLLTSCGAEDLSSALQSADKIDFETDPVNEQDCSVPLFGKQYRNQVYTNKHFFIQDEGTYNPDLQPPVNQTEGEWIIDGGTCNYEVDIRRQNFYSADYIIHFRYENDGFDETTCLAHIGYYTMKKNCDVVTVCKQGVCESYKAY